MLLTTAIARINHRLVTWQSVSRQRRELRRISDHLLKDVGLSRVDADREAARPFWDTDDDFDPTLVHYHQRETGRARSLPAGCCPRS